MRPQEKMQRYGIDSLSVIELLALILRTGKKGKGVMMVAKELAESYIRQEEKISLETLRNIVGIGYAKASTLMASLELGKRLYGNKKTRLILKPEDVWREMREEAVKKKEFFVLFFLDTRNQIIKKETISIGTLNTSIVHPREVFEMAVQNHAGQVILAHNHPSGETTPSPEDIQTTRRLMKAGKILGIEVLDHVVVTPQSFYSMKDKGIL